MTYGADPLASEASDPRTEPARLAELAAAYPHLHPLIAANPACYEALRDWMRQVAAPQPQSQGSADEAPVAHHAVATPPSDAARRQVFGTPVQQGLLERAYTPVDDEAAARRRRKRVLLIVLAIVVALVVAAGSVFGVLYATGAVLGGRSPEQAAERFALGVGNADALGVVGSSAPSEAAHLRAPIEQLLDLDLGPAGTGSEAVGQLRAALSLRFEEAEYTVEELGEGIALVEPSAGTAVLDGDPAELARILTGLAEPALRAGLDVPLLPDPAAAEDEPAAGGPVEEPAGEPEPEPEPEVDADPDAVVDRYRQSTEERLAETLPATVELNGEEAAAFAVVTVEEGTGWYASPLLTAAELAYRDLGEEAPPRGEPRAAADLPQYGTPLLAAEALTTGIVTALQGGGLDAAAAALSLPERRLVEIYGGALIMPELPQPQLELVELGLTANEPTADEDAPIGGSLDLLLDGKPLELSATCSVLEEQPNERVERCLTDSALLEGLGVEEWRPVAVREDDGWRVGGTATLGDVLGIAVERYAQLVAAGEVGRLVDPAPAPEGEAPAG